MQHKTDQTASFLNPLFMSKSIHCHSNTNTRALMTKAVPVNCLIAEIK